MCHLWPNNLSNVQKLEPKKGISSWEGVCQLCFNFTHKSLLDHFLQQVISKYTFQRFFFLLKLTKAYLEISLREFAQQNFLNKIKKLFIISRKPKQYVKSPKTHGTHQPFKPLKAFHTTPLHIQLLQWPLYGCTQSWPIECLSSILWSRQPFSPLIFTSIQVPPYISYPYCDLTAGCGEALLVVMNLTNRQKAS